jgi:hypothetical protein
MTGLIGIAFGKSVKVMLAGGVTALEVDADGEGPPRAQILRDALNQNLQRGRAGILTDHTGNGIGRCSSEPALKVKKVARTITQSTFEL